MIVIQVGYATPPAGGGVSHIERGPSQKKIGPTRGGGGSDRIPTISLDDDPFAGSYIEREASK